MGCDIYNDVNKRMEYVSIHAPAWGATLRRPSAVSDQRVSIHAPAWGATKARIAISGTEGFQSTHPHGVRLRLVPFLSFVKGFNPRTRMGCDAFLPFRVCLYSSVSIHAPAWGATKRSANLFHFAVVSIHAPAWGATYVYPRKNRFEQFQSTHPHGVRRIERKGHTPGFAFQSTHPHGVRHGKNVLRLSAQCFNPRTRMGCDKILTCFATPYNVSIHAPAWGATALSSGQARAQEFQSTHPHGVRPHLRGRQRGLVKCFNPRTRMGCDLRCARSQHKSGCFNPRTRMGCDYKSNAKVLRIKRFNPRTRMGCDK